LKTARRLPVKMWTYGHALSGFWHYAAQAANRKKEMTRIGAVRFTIARSCKAASAFWLFGLQRAFV
jgi:hypothetical protein